MTATDPANDRWYETGLVYAVDVETFVDSDGDGVGDFPGLTDRLEYLARLGVTCLWLLPFYPTPNRDNGYDVTAYYGVDPRLGTLGDFVRFVREAHSHGLRVLTDLPVNHTSDEHPWFRAAREDPESKYRDYYVWADDPPEPEHPNIFAAEGEEIWTYDDAADAYYYHRFYHFEPGLDHSNPAVRREIRDIMGFWLELGVDGFRIDALPLLLDRKGLDSTEIEEPHAVLRELREFVERRRQGAVLLGEAGGSPDRVREYFGDGDEMHMLLNFLLAGYLFHALATADVETLIQELKQLTRIPDSAQWGNFLRNLDELNLEWLTESQRQAVFEAFAPDEEMRVFDRGIRRRLAPMFDGDRRRLELAWSLLFSMPGTPIISYGDEIGMGDDLSLDGRSAARTPMQWSGERNAGFSTAPADELVRPIVDEGPYGYERVNVEDQRFDRDSMLSWMERLIWTRREHPAVGRGEYQYLDTGDPTVLAHRSRATHDVVAVHNFADEPRTVTLDLGDTDVDRLVPVFGDHQYDPVAADTPELELPGHGYCWLRVGHVQPSRSEASPDDR